MPIIDKEHFRPTARATKAQDLGILLRKQQDLTGARNTRIEKNLTQMSAQAMMPIMRNDDQLGEKLLDTRVYPALVALVWRGGAELNEVPDEVLSQLMESMRPHEVYQPTVRKIDEILENRVISLKAGETLTHIALGDGFPDPYLLRLELGSDNQPYPAEKSAAVLQAQYERWQEAENQGRLTETETERLNHIKSLPKKRGFGEQEPDVPTMLRNMVDDNFGWRADHPDEKTIRSDYFFARANMRQIETVLAGFRITEETLMLFFDLGLLPTAREDEEDRIVYGPTDLVAAMYLNELNPRVARDQKVSLGEWVMKIGADIEDLRNKLAESDNRPGPTG